MKTIDDMRDDLSALGTEWSLVTDRVMGGVTEGRLSREDVEGRTARRITGDVRLDNDGGFLQMALDLAPEDGAFDASAYEGIVATVRGNGEDYDLRLRTHDTDHSWQSWRHGFHAGPEWGEVRLPFSAFEAHRIDKPLDLHRLRRLGLVAIGRAFHADLAVSRLAFY